MKKVIVLLTCLATIACSTTPQPYFKVGAGYKFDETRIDYYDGSTNHPISARFELGVEQGSFTYGVSHHSQWFVGEPFNDSSEYQKTEVFVDYKFQL